MEHILSTHFKTRKPSAIRLAQIEHMKREDNVQAVNTAIGNVNLPMHPAMQKRMFDLKTENCPFKDGVVKYSATVGYKETNDAFLNIISSSGFDTDNLYCQITDGGSQAMELVILGVCGDAGSTESPLLLIDAAYTNYKAMAERVGRSTVSVQRHLSEEGNFTLPDMDEIEMVIKKKKPGALLVIPYDNPTGQFYDHKSMVKLAKLCVENDIWMISDEAYRELHYVDHDTVSIWGLTEQEIPGINKRRISIETSSKVWNACGLRIGGIVTDSKLFNTQSIAEYTANLCPNVIGQYIFGALANVSHKDLKGWYNKQRKYYKDMLFHLKDEFLKRIPGIIVSSPDASIYSIIDVRNICKTGFDAEEFVMYCARKGKVKINGTETTLLVSPMAEFYDIKKGEKNPGKTQMRIAFVQEPTIMKQVPKLFTELFKQYNSL